MLNRLILFGLTCFPFVLNAQGLNGGFESVHAGGIPAGWSRIVESGASLTSDAFSGDKAAKSWVTEYYKPGGWVSVAKPPAAAGLPSGLSGVYKYEGRRSECDPAVVQVFATRRNGQGQLDTLARGETELLLSKKYRTFSLDVDALSGTTQAEFLSVRIEARGRCDWHIGDNCCFLFADDLAFDEQYAGRIPAADPDAIDREPEDVQPVTEPVFIQPVRKKRKRRSFILRPGKHKTPKKINKTRRGRKAKKVEPVPPQPPGESTTIPPEIQREIDRINAAQQDSTPDPAKAAEEKRLQERMNQQEEKSSPDEYPMPEEGDEEGGEGDGWVPAEEDEE